jgi:helix-turn-helix protein
MAKTNKPMIRIHDLATNEIIDREMNDEEFSQWEIDKANNEASQTEAEAKAAQRQAILDRLGLTSEEAALLLS